MSRAVRGSSNFPVWSPDGKRIAFNGNLDAADTANTDVYHVDAVDGSDPVRVTTAAGFDGRCDWLANPLPVAPPKPPPAGPVLTPPVVTPPAALAPAKLSIARARLLRGDREIDVLAPITSLASGDVKVELHAAGMRTRFTAPVDSRDGRIRFRTSIPAKQADLGTGILTLSYGGDADTRPQTVRLRAAARRALLKLDRPTIENGRLRARGTINGEARGVVRVQIQYVADGQTRQLEYRAPISNGTWSLDEKLAQNVVDGIARRVGTVHSYTLFTGYMPRRIRGEMRSYQVLGER
ncbi:MAG: TolB family protein [Solirubrobacteraceae bacterium]